MLSYGQLTYKQYGCQHEENKMFTLVTHSKFT